ncbi:MAG: metal-sensing transcriptional repressor [Candidatus Dojkabacteria bacterium]|jgi:DNA-binding FrmR family transcriptional regulator
MKNDKHKALINLKKSKGLIETVIKMIEEDQYCINIMQQNLAVIGLLKSANQTLMESHLHHCFANALESNQEKRKAEMIEEILTVTKLLNR